MMTIEQIIASCEDKKDRKNNKKARKKVSKDLEKFHSKEDALDRVMSDLQASIIEDSWEEEINNAEDNNTDDVEEELNDVEEETDEEIEENEDDDTKIDEYVSGSKYYINDRMRFCVTDEYIGTQAFSIYRSGEDFGELDDDTLGVLSTLICLKVESTGTPFLICRKKDLINALKGAGISSFNIKNFFILDQFKDFDTDDYYVYGYYAEDKLSEWNNIIDFFIDEDMSNESIIEILMDVVKETSNRTFMDAISDNEFTHIIESGDFGDIDEFIDLISNDKDTQFDNDIPDEEIEDLFISPNFFEREMKLVLGGYGTGMEGVEHDQEPFQSNEGDNGNELDRHGDSDIRPEKSGVQEEETAQEKTEEKKEEETEENGQSMEDDALAREIQEGFEEISGGVS